MPEFLRIAVESDRLELLTGDTLPASVRRWRRIRGGLLVLMALLGFVIGVIGVERRGFALREEAARVHDAALELVDLTIPPETAGVSSDPRVRLLTAVRALPESADHDAGTLRDAALDLARVLDLWPAHDGVVLASLVTDQQGWRIVAEAGSAESAQAWAADFRDMQPAARAEIRSNGTRSAITVTGSHEMGPVMRGRQESAARTSGGGRP